MFIAFLVFMAKISWKSIIRYNVSCFMTFYCLTYLRTYIAETSLHHSHCHRHYHHLHRHRHLHHLHNHHHCDDNVYYHAANITKVASYSGVQLGSYSRYVYTYSSPKFTPSNFHLFCSLIKQVWMKSSRCIKMLSIPYFTFR